MTGYQKNYANLLISKKLQEKEQRKNLKLSYRADYFYRIRLLPKHTRCYKKFAYVIRAHGKH